MKKQSKGNISGKATTGPIDKTFGGGKGMTKEEREQRKEKEKLFVSQGINLTLLEY